MSPVSHLVNPYMARVEHVRPAALPPVPLLLRYPLLGFDTRGRACRSRRLTPASWGEPELPRRFGPHLSHLMQELHGFAWIRRQTGRGAIGNVALDLGEVTCRSRLAEAFGLGEVLHGEIATPGQPFPPKIHFAQAAMGVGITQSCRLLEVLRGGGLVLSDAFAIEVRQRQAARGDGVASLGSLGEVTYSFLFVVREALFAVEVASRYVAQSLGIARLYGVGLGVGYKEHT